MKHTTESETAPPDDFQEYVAYRAKQGQAKMPHVAKFKVGDRIKITKAHEDMKVGAKGTIAIVSEETAYGINMDAAMEEEEGTHKWYVDSEIAKA